jgi:hypothetical protein
MMDSGKLKNLFSHDPSGQLKTNENIRFCTEEDIACRNVPMSSSKNGRVIALLQLRTLSVHPFSLPLGKNGRVRDALRMSFRSLLGNDDDSILMIPQVTEQDLTGLRGSYVRFKTEIEEAEKRLGNGIAIWPALWFYCMKRAAAVWQYGALTAAPPGCFLKTALLSYTDGCPIGKCRGDLEKWFADYSRSADMPYIMS